MRFCDIPSQECGSAVLELAFSLPMFVLLILGGAEMANIAWASVQLNNAAHAGAQFGSISRANAADTTDLETAAQREASFTITFPTAPATVCTCVDPSSGTQNPNPPGACAGMGTTCTSPSIILASIQVTTQAVVHPLIHYPGLPASYTLSAQASMGIVQ